MPRALLDINEEHVEDLARRCWTNVEIASHFGCNESTIRRRFAEAANRGRRDGQARLREKQMEVAHSGNPTMLVWMGKQILGQSDKQTVDTTVTRAASELDLAELERYRAAMAEAKLELPPATKRIQHNVTLEVQAEVLPTGSN